MNRRESLAALGAAAAGLTTLINGTARGDDTQHNDHFAKCAKACADCQQHCDSCFHHCATQLAAGKKEHEKTMHTCVDCAECCKVAATLSARQSPFARYACECCAKCNDECAAACEKFPSDAHMAACAKSCRDCAKACREMIQHMAH